MVTRGQALYHLRTGAKGSGTLSVVHGGKGVRHFAGCAQGHMGSDPSLHRELMIGSVIGV